jgi:polygalacturonase
MDSIYTLLRDAELSHDPVLLVPDTAVAETSALLLWALPRRLADRELEYTVLCNGEIAARTSAQSCTLHSLEPGTEYAVRVLAMDIREANSCGRNEDGFGRHIRASTSIVRFTTKRKGQIFNVRDHGAAGDGTTDDTAAIQGAVNAAVESTRCGRGPDGTTRGGGTQGMGGTARAVVLLPPGVYRVGTITLGSDLTLRFADGAVLSLVERYEDPQETNRHFPPVETELDGPDGPVPYRSMGAIRGTDLENVTIEGTGLILGNGATWWKRVCDYHGMRPFMLELIRCRNVLIQGVTFQDSPFWNLHAVYCESVVFNQVTVQKRAAGSCNNGDGINPDSSRNVLIVGCMFANHDDSIAIKSGKREEASDYRRQRPCEDIVVRDCAFDCTTGSQQTGAISVGSEMSGSVRRVLIENCTMRDTSGLVCIKTLRGRGGTVEHVTVRRIRHTSSGWHHKSRGVRAAIKIEMLYWEPDTLDPKPVDAGTPRIAAITYEDISFEQRNGRGVYVRCLPEMPGADLVFRRVRGISELPNQFLNAGGLLLEDVVFTASSPETGSASGAETPST